jgi:hypothetical protein
MFLLRPCCDRAVGRDWVETWSNPTNDRATWQQADEAVDRANWEESSRQKTARNKGIATGTTCHSPQIGRV